MRFESTTDQLLSGVSLASRFVQRAANLPALSSILVAAEGGVVVLRATNLECGVEVTVPAKVLEGGIVAVPGTVFAGFLQNSHGKKINAALSGEVFKVQSERSQASLKTIPHDDFPTLPKVSAEQAFKTRGGDFARAIRSVVYCASSSAIKPELQSVYISGEAGKLTLAATDSFRLAEKVIPLLSKGSVKAMLLPMRNAAEFMKILDGFPGEVEVYYNDHQLSAHLDNVYYTSRLLDGTFPNYKQIIPTEFATEAVVLREDLASALKGLSVFADKFSQVSFTIDPKNKAIALASRNQDIGEEVCTLNATVMGAEATMTFNGRYLADSLQAISGDSIRLCTNGPGKPLLIKDASDNSFLYLAMPMNR